MDLREIEWALMDWIHVTQERDEWRALVNTVMNGATAERQHQYHHGKLCTYTKSITNT
jgi:hypothetical protein